MARHSQKTERKHFICSPCHRSDCIHCVDILRMAFTDETICECTKASHSVEPNDAQIRDPETGTVYAPGLEVDIDGKVTFYAETPSGEHGGSSS